MDYFDEIYAREILRLTDKKISTEEELDQFIDNIEDEMTRDQIEEMIVNITKAMHEDGVQEVEREYPKKRRLPRLSNSPRLTFP
jgi:hypothetical protein